MIRIQPVDGKRTARFSQPRPLSAVRPTHVHGALDIAAGIGAPIVAPEAGRVFGYVAIRPDSATRWPEVVAINGGPFEFSNYFYHTYGGVLVVKGESGATHILTHSYLNQIFNRAPLGALRVKVFEPKDSAWPLAMATAITQVKAGELIGSVGNAGFSTGSHVHWEIHPGRGWAQHADRVDPEQWLEG